MVRTIEALGRLRGEAYRLSVVEEVDVETGCKESRAGVANGTAVHEPLADGMVGGEATSTVIQDFLLHAGCRHNVSLSRRNLWQKDLRKTDREYEERA